ncbi:3-deoxy-D-manno-octulosonic acid kinase [Halomonas alkalicola]|uniref:3-deoxy-D-manno-octulosonic acid kinase n=1 Tax=Halomonas alkalicola TaxID=1930622 RepID=UPI00266048CC|nr:3-deoxy-D-manno-octulosonic acid kinase [Halomonas alkalicola]
MGLATCRAGKVFILYDAARLCDAAAEVPPGPQLVDPDHWRSQGRVTGEAPGRGASLFLDAGSGHEWVLRPYRRGGLIARLSAKRYLWTGLEQTRAFRELRLTAALHERGLPVPRPVAAAVTRLGLTYEATLITERLPGARALAERLEARQAGDALLAEVGRTIRRFHDAGLDHVDLNARNLLVDEAQRVWLIDLDRCRLRPKGAWQDANLARLERSLVKFGAGDAMAPIRRGYGEAPASG